MKLYELERGSKFRLLEEPHHAPSSRCCVKQEYTLGNIDGMYSNSVGEDKETYYFAAWSEVEEIKSEC